MGFVDASGKILDGNYASFLLPKRWARASPMTYRREHTRVVSATVNGESVGDAMLVYGYSKMLWDSCDYDSMATDATYTPDGTEQYAGQICIMVARAPRWTARPKRLIPGRIGRA